MYIQYLENNNFDNRLCFQLNFHNLLNIETYFIELLNTKEAYLLFVNLLINKNTRILTEHIGVFVALSNSEHLAICRSTIRLVIRENDCQFVFLPHNRMPSYVACGV